MAVNWSTDCYLPNYDKFARDITVTPTMSQPGQPAYAARGIWDDEAMDVAMLDGGILSEDRLVMDVREVEFAVVPIQGDRIDIPATINGIPAEGSFEIIDCDRNGGGETTLTLRKVVTAKP
jgi:hypothetical protein